MQIILILFLYLYSVILFILWLKRPYNWETGINVDHNSTAVPYLMPLQQTKPLWCSHTYQPHHITKACVNCSVLDRGLLIQLNLSLSTVPSEYGHIFHTAGLFFRSQRHQTSCTPFVHMTDISIMRTLFFISLCVHIEKFRLYVEILFKAPQVVRGLKFTFNAGITRSYSDVYFSVKVGFNICVGWMKSLCLTIRLEALRKNNGYATNVKCCSTSLLVTNANQTSFVQSYLLLLTNPRKAG